MSQLRIICTGHARTGHGPTELALVTAPPAVTGATSDGTDLWLFDRAISEAHGRTPRRSSPQREIYERERQAWRFRCPRCGLDVQLSNASMFALFRKYADRQEGGVSVVDLSDPPG